MKKLVILIVLLIPSIEIKACEDVRVECDNLKKYYLCDGGCCLRKGYKK